MKTENEATGGESPPAAASCASGGGTTLYPSRHSATNEVLAATSMFLLRYGMIPVMAEWSMPKTEKANVTSVTMEPNTDVEVEVCRRKGFETGRWVCSIGKVVAEDRDEQGIEISVKGLAYRAVRWFIPRCGWWCTVTPCTHSIVSLQRGSSYKMELCCSFLS